MYRKRIVLFVPDRSWNTILACQMVYRQVQESLKETVASITEFLSWGIC